MRIRSGRLQNKKTDSRNSRNSQLVEIFLSLFDINGLILNHSRNPLSATDTDTNPHTPDTDLTITEKI